MELLRFVALTSGGFARPAPPAITRLDDVTVLIVDGGRVYRLNTESMAVEAVVKYVDASRQSLLAFLKAMAAMSEGTQEHEREATLRATLSTLQNTVDLYNNAVGAFPEDLKQLCLPDGPLGYDGPYLLWLPEHPYPGGLFQCDFVTGEATETHPQ